MLLNQRDAMLELNTLQHNINIELFFLHYKVNMCFFCIAIAQLTTSMHNATLTPVFFFFAKKSTTGDTVSNFWREYPFFSKSVRGINTRVPNTKSECTIRRFIIIGVQLFFIWRKHFSIGHFFMQQCGTSGAFNSWRLFSLAACPPSKHSSL